MNEKDAGQNLESRTSEFDSLKVVSDALRGLKFGTVKLIVQDGDVVRVERTENRLVPKTTRIK